MSYTFHHNQLLPLEVSLLVDEQEHTLSLWQAGERVTSQTFTEQEFTLLCLFFTQSDGAIHCTYNEALSVLIEEPMEACISTLQVARERDERDETHHYNLLQVMKPVIVTLEQCQVRLHQLGLHACAIWNYGYVMDRYEVGAL